MAINKYQDYLNSIMMNQVLKEEVAPAVTPKVEPVVQNATTTQAVGTLADLFKTEEATPTVASKISDIGQQMLKYQADIANQFSYRRYDDALAYVNYKKYYDNLPDMFKNGDYNNQHFLNNKYNQHIGLDVPVPVGKVYSKDGTLLANKAYRNVIGQYGSFIEILPEDMIMDNLKVAKNQEYRIDNPRYANSVKYAWYVPKDTTNAKIYAQKRGVTYADYQPNRFYLSPYEIDIKEDLGSQQMNNISDFSLPEYIKPAKGVYVQEGQPLAYTLSKDKVIDGINYPKNTIFLNRLPKEDPIGYFMNYTQNSEQKKAVMNKLIQDGAIFSIDDIRQLLSNDKDAYRFLLWHEQSHVNNNDAEVYFKNGKDKMTSDKIDIEARATLDALNKLRAYKAYTNSKDLGEAQFKVISGGQTGIDILGVDEAYKLGIPTGGTINYFDNHYQTEYDDKINRDLYNFTKNNSRNYTDRTSLNVQNSDGTIYFANDLDSTGYKATKRYATQFNKPFLENPKTSEEAYNWMQQNNIKTLNIAGNRGSKVSPEMHNEVQRLLYQLYLTVLNKK